MSLVAARLGHRGIEEATESENPPPIGPGSRRVRATMVRSIYRSGAGRTAVRSWCEERTAASGATTTEVATSLGPTRVTSIGTGRAVILLPGTNFATATWLDMLGRVGAGYRAIGIDLPGQPGLSAPHRPRDRDAYGPWLNEAIAAAGAPRPIVVGHSLGGRVALLAASASDAIAGLVLVDPAGLIRLRVTPGLLATTMGWLMRRDEPSAAALLRRMAAPGSRPEPRLVQWMALVGRHVRSSLAPSPLGAGVLASVRCPVALVTGAHDPFLPPGPLVAAADRIGGPVTTEVVEGAGHLLPHEAPVAVVGSIAAIASIAA
jgi:pimeloyl-ACP methyl ester carboxylesterase